MIQGREVDPKVSKTFPASVFQDDVILETMTVEVKP